VRRRTNPRVVIQRLMAARERSPGQPNMSVRALAFDSRNGTLRAFLLLRRSTEVLFLDRWGAALHWAKRLDCCVYGGTASATHD